jgi:hypothetical protein
MAAAWSVSILIFGQLTYASWASRIKMGNLPTRSEKAGVICQPGKLCCLKPIYGISLTTLKTWTRSLFRLKERMENMTTQRSTVMHPDPEASYFHKNSTLTLALSPSTPISKISSPMYLCGGTTRFAGAGTFLKTRPARSNFEPWHGQK